MIWIVLYYFMANIKMYVTYFAKQNNLLKLSSIHTFKSSLHITHEFSSTFLLWTGHFTLERNTSHMFIIPLICLTSPFLKIYCHHKRLLIYYHFYETYIYICKDLLHFNLFFLFLDLTFSIKLNIKISSMMDPI